MTLMRCANDHEESKSATMSPGATAFDRTWAASQTEAGL